MVVVGVEVVVDVEDIAVADVVVVDVAEVEDHIEVVTVDVVVIEAEDHIEVDMVIKEINQFDLIQNPIQWKKIMKIIWMIKM